MFQDNGYKTTLCLPAPKGKLNFFKKFGFYKKFIKILFSVRKGVLSGKDIKYVSGECMKIIGLCEQYGGHVEIIGIDNIRKVDGGAVIAANHMSTLETLLFPAILDGIKPHTFVVKKSLVENGVFGPIMKLFNPIALDRKEPRVDLHKVLTDGSAALSEGKSVVLFPQGTRLPDFDPSTFNSLAVKLAKKSGVPVIPCALKTDFWENGHIVSTIGDIYPERIIHIAFGKPVYIDGAGRKEQEQIVEFIDSSFKGWLAEKQ